MERLTAVPDDVLELIASSIERNIIMNSRRGGQVTATFASLNKHQSTKRLAEIVASRSGRQTRRAIPDLSDQAMMEGDDLIFLRMMCVYIYI